MAVVEGDAYGHGAEDDDEVVLIGQQGNETIRAEDVAGWSDTIAYEVVSKLRAGLVGGSVRMPKG